MHHAAVRHSTPAADTDSPVPTFRPYFVNLAQKVVEKLFDTHMCHAAVRHSAPAADTDSPVPTFRPYFANLAQSLVEKLFDTHMRHAAVRPVLADVCSDAGRRRIQRLPPSDSTDGAVRLDTRGRPTRTSRRPTHRGRHGAYPFLSPLITKPRSKPFSAKILGIGFTTENIGFLVG